MFLWGLWRCPIVLIDPSSWGTGSSTNRWLLRFFFDLTVSQAVIILGCCLVIVKWLLIPLGVSCWYWRGYELRKVLIEDFWVYTSWWGVLHETILMLWLISCREVCDVDSLFGFYFGLFFFHRNVTDNILFALAFLIKNNHLTRHLFHHPHYYILDFFSSMILIFIHRRTWLLFLLLNHGFLLMSLILSVLLIVCHSIVFGVLSRGSSTCLCIVLLFRVLFPCLLGSLLLLLWTIVSFLNIRALLIISMLMQTFHKVVHDVCVGQLGLLLVSLLLDLSWLLNTTSFRAYSIGYFYFCLRHRLLLLRLVRLFLLLLLVGLGFIRGRRFLIIHLLVLVLLFLGIFLLLSIVFRLGLLIM